MKKTLAAFTLLAGTTCLYSQGQVTIADYSGPFAVQIMNVQSSAPINATAYFSSYNGYTSGVEYYGNTSNPNGNMGTTVYDPTSGIGGSGFDVQMLAAPGSGDALSTLSAMGPITQQWYAASPGGNPATGFSSFYKATNGVGSVLTVPNTGANGPITLAIAVWNNEGGTINTLLGAQQAGAPWGISPTTVSVPMTGGGIVIPPFIPDTIPDFSIGAALVPEPSTIALGVIGASALLLRRRK
jgi:hypothetical protein